MSRATCRHPQRLHALKHAGTLSTLNAVEYVEVRDGDEPVPALRQRTLLVRLVRPVPPGLGPQNVRLEGGERITSVPVQWVAAGDSAGPADASVDFAALVADLDEPDHVLVVRTAYPGDFSTYRLRLVAGGSPHEPPPGFDPLLAEAELRFKDECASDFDCADRPPRPPAPASGPAIDYLAKDYQGFRRLLLERMALLVPGWQERNPADLGVTLVEVLAYLADELSYRQDAVATEAYLNTARSRVSLRRHARLVDYRVHEGCNARAWLWVATDRDTLTLPAGTTVLTRVPGLPPLLRPDSVELRTARAAGPEVFESVETAVVHRDLNAGLRFHTWGDADCHLPPGATSATLRGRHPHLRAGDALVLLASPAATGTAGPTASADPTDPTGATGATGTSGTAGAGSTPPRAVGPGTGWAVRLVEVRDSADPSGGLFDDPPHHESVAVTEIRWHPQDALPFALPLGPGDDPAGGARALANIVLVDHGQTVPDRGTEELPAVPDRPRPRYRPPLARGPLTHTLTRPAATLFTAPAPAEAVRELRAGRYGEALRELLLAHGQDLPADSAQVRGADPLWSVDDGARVVRLLRTGERLRGLGPGWPAATTAPGRTAGPRQARPAVDLWGGAEGASLEPWSWEPDLLASGPAQRVFTTEAEHDGSVRLRFGDDHHGLRPAAGATFRVRYRVGGGTVGNVGAGSLAHLVAAEGVRAVSNPLPAVGGVEPESAEEIRRDAPRAFAVQERAVTEQDWAEVAGRTGLVQRAAATFRWTGSWHTVFVTADRPGGRNVDPGFARELRARLERYRLAGYDLEVDGPRPVPLEIDLQVCVADGHLRSDVRTAVLQVLGDTVLPDGRRGLFHPDDLTFGQPVHLSGVYAAAHSVPGVESVQVRTFRRARQPETSGLASGVLPMGRLEIAQLDNDPDFPERGVLRLSLEGGR